MRHSAYRGGCKGTVGVSVIPDVLSDIKYVDRYSVRHEVPVTCLRIINTKTCCKGVRSLSRIGGGKRQSLVMMFNTNEIVVTLLTRKSVTPV